MGRIRDNSESKGRGYTKNKITRGIRGGLAHGGGKFMEQVVNNCYNRVGGTLGGLGGSTRF